MCSHPISKMFHLWKLPVFKLNKIDFLMIIQIIILFSHANPCAIKIFGFVCCVYTGHHTVYIGVHVPKSYHRRRRHRRRSSHKEKKERVNEGVSDKSDIENLNDSATNILKPLSESHNAKIPSMPLGFQFCLQ